MDSEILAHSPALLVSILLCCPHFFLCEGPGGRSSVSIYSSPWYWLVFCGLDGPCNPNKTLAPGSQRESWSWELFYQYSQIFSLWSEPIAQVLNIFQYFISGSGSEGHMSILFSWSLTSNFPRTQLMLGSCIMEFVYLQDNGNLEYSCQWLRFISHPPEKVT